MSARIAVLHYTLSAHMTAHMVGALQHEERRQGENREDQAVAQSSHARGSTGGQGRHSFLSVAGRNGHVRATAGVLTRWLGRWLHGQRRRRVDCAGTENQGAARSGTNQGHNLGARADLSHCWGRNRFFRKAAVATGRGST